jgi:thiol-disulfide isomerase/thioredoxin
MKNLYYFCFHILVFSILSACGGVSVSTPVSYMPTDPPYEPPSATESVSYSVGIEINNIAPNFTLSDIYGNTYELWSLRGYPVLVNFWATWCGPCLYEMPAIQAIYEKYSGQGLVILAINGDGESTTDIYNYQQEHSLSFPLLVDIERNAESAYQIEAFPTTVLIDRDGIIRYIDSGAMEEDDFEQLLTSTILVNNAPIISGNTIDSPIIELPGEYWYSDITESHVYSTNPLSEREFYNFIIQTDVKIDSETHEYHGLMFRQVDGENFYSFRITPDGYFEFDVWHSGDSSFETILGPTQSNYIYQGVGQINTLRVVAVNENFDLYINGEYVGSISDNRFQFGKVGAISCTCDGSSRASASFQNFSMFEQP